MINWKGPKELYKSFAVAFLVITNKPYIFDVVVVSFRAWLYKSTTTSM